MLISAYDTETTGLDTKNDRIIEVGFILYDTDARQPVRMYDTLIRPRDPLPEGYVSPTGIKGEWLTQHGVSLPEALGEIQRMIAAMPEAIVVGHNVINYDKQITMAELEREQIVGHGLAAAHYIDTRQDLPLEKEPSSRKLIHMLAEYGKTINPFEHRALFDAAACLKLIDLFPFETILEMSKIPLVTIRACITYQMEKERQGAKDLRYNWNGEKKLWTKDVRENALEREKAAAAQKGFEIVRIT